MFTGIIEALGEVAALQARGGDMRLYIRSAGLPFEQVKLGDSIATNGVCLTVVDLPGDGFWADVSRETLAHSGFASAQVGQRVNLERAMAANGRFDGHIVSGHVDGVGQVLEVRRDARSLRLRIEAPANLQRYIAAKGSICVDGVSLTVNQVAGAVFELNIVPHTAAETIIPGYAAGSRVNLEVDIVARYLERLLHFAGSTESEESAESGLSMAKLAENGFLKTSFKGRR
jgi:riboflavin synthase